MENKKIKKTKKVRKEKNTKSKVNKNKNKNKNTQSIKINISSSGGLGGSGGTPSFPIPIPVQSFNKAANVGENVNVNNLLKQMQNQQQSSYNNLNSAVSNIASQIRNPIFEGEFMPYIKKKDLRPFQDAPLLEQINRDDKIDAAENVNDGNDNNNFFEPIGKINEEKKVNNIYWEDLEDVDEIPPPSVNIPIVYPPKDTTNNTLFENIIPSALPIEIKNPEQEQQTPEQEIPKSEIGGGGKETVKKPIKLTERLYIKENSPNSFTFSYDKKSQGRFKTLQEAQDKRREYFDLNNIKYIVPN